MVAEVCSDDFVIAMLVDGILVAREGLLGDALELVLRQPVRGDAHVM